MSRLTTLALAALILYAGSARAQEDDDDPKAAPRGKKPAAAAAQPAPKPVVTPAPPPPPAPKAKAEPKPEAKPEPKMAEPKPEPAKKAVAAAPADPARDLLNPARIDKRHASAVPPIPPPPPPAEPQAPARSVRVRLLDGSSVVGSVRAEQAEALVIDCALGQLTIPRIRISTIAYDAAAGASGKHAPVLQLDDDVPAPRKRQPAAQ